MGKLLMGRELSSLSKSEIDELMAKMRSKRKNGNGRLGKKNKDPQMFYTDNFPTGRKRKVGERKKFTNEHIKCVFVCSRELYPKKYANAQRPIYIFGFLTDSNKFAFDEFKDTKGPQVRDITDEGSYRLQKFSHLFRQKNIDGDTFFVVDIDRMSEISFVYSQISLMCSFTGAKLKDIKTVDIIRALVKEYGIYKTNRVYKNCEKYKKKKIDSVLWEIYTFMTENRLCPWITKESHEAMYSLSKYKRHSLVIAHLGLFYSILKKFNRMLTQKKKKKEDA